MRLVFGFEGLGVLRDVSDDLRVMHDTYRLISLDRVLLLLDSFADLLLHSSQSAGVRRVHFLLGLLLLSQGLVEVALELDKSADVEGGDGLGNIALTLDETDEFVKF